MTLSASDRAVLDFEREWWRSRDRAATKGSAIRARLHISPTSYYAALGRLATSPDATAYDPLVVHRIRRRLTERRRARVLGPARGRQQR